MSAARDLAICRAVAADYGKIPPGAPSDTYLRAIIAAVDASLGGEAQLPVSVVDDAGGRDDVAEPSSDLQRYFEANHMDGEKLPAPAVTFSASAAFECFMDGRREAKREAVGIIRELVDGTASEAVFVAALQYIATADADATEEGKP